MKFNLGQLTVFVHFLLSTQTIHFTQHNKSKEKPLDSGFKFLPETKIFKRRHLFAQLQAFQWRLLSDCDSKGANGNS